MWLTETSQTWWPPGSGSCDGGPLRHHRGPAGGQELAVTDETGPVPRRDHGAPSEQTSWRNPGRVSSLVRHPPPGVLAPSMTWTDRPARANVMAAASPLGPDPTTTASNSVTIDWRPLVASADSTAGWTAGRSNNAERHSSAAVPSPDSPIPPGSRCRSVAFLGHADELSHQGC